jgi:hypothetical protein
MPANYRAIVTLGPGLTKDQLAQGKPFLFFPPFFGWCGSGLQLIIGSLYTYTKTRKGTIYCILRFYESLPQDPRI